MTQRGRFILQNISDNILKMETVSCSERLVPIYQNIGC